MNRYQIENTASGEVFGIYEGSTPEQALDALARDAGYDSQSHLESVIYETDEYARECRADLLITQIMGD